MGVENGGAHDFVAAREGLWRSTSSDWRRSVIVDVISSFQCASGADGLMRIMLHVTLKFEEEAREEELIEQRASRKLHIGLACCTGYNR